MIDALAGLSQLWFTGRPCRRTPRGRTPPALYLPTYGKPTVRIAPPER